MAAPRRPLPVRTSEALVRFCLSCAATLGCWCVWLVLGGALAAQIYMIAARELPVPGFVRSQIESHLAAEGFALSFGRAQFDPAGRLLIEDARLRLGQFEDALVVAESVFLRKSPWAILSGALTPDEVRIHHATLRIPAPLSPTGTAEPLLRDIHATFRLDGPVVHVDQLSFRCGPLAVHVQGDFVLPPRGAERATAGAVARRLLRGARELVRELPRLDCLEHPSLFATLAARPGVGNVAELRLTAGGASRPLDLPVKLGPLVAETVIRLDGSGERPLRLVLELERLDTEGGWTASGVAASLATQVGLRPWTAPGEVTADFSAREITALGGQADAPAGVIRWQSGGAALVSLAAAVHGAVIAATAVGDPARRAGSVEVTGGVPPSLVAAALGPRAPKFERHLRFQDPVSVRAEARFADGGRFEDLRARVRGRGLDSNGVAFTSFRGRIDADAAGNFRAHGARVEAGGNHATGSYEMNFRTHDFRMLLTGALHPPHIGPWFRGGWWNRFWEGIQFPAEAPRADVDVRGNWRDAGQTTYFGWTDAGPAVVLGADFERARARVFLRPHFAHAFDIDAVRAGGGERAGGWFKRRVDVSTRLLDSIEYDLAGRLDPAVLRRLGGATADGLLARWTFSAPPEIAFRGRTHFRDGRPSPELTFRGSAEGPLSHAGFPLGRVSAAGTVSGSTISIDPIELEVAGGRGSAVASLSGEGDQRRLGFDFYLRDADLVKGIGALHEFERSRSAGQTGTSPNEALLKRVSGGRLNFALSAQGSPEDIASFTGSGNLEVAGAELGEIHLFGLLSQVLSGLMLDFSSMRFDTLRGSFRLGDGRVHFPDIKVSGPTALIDGHGDFRMEGRTLDFAARFTPYEGGRNIITGVIGIVINPLASILELRLTGPVSKPSWTVTLGGGGPRDTRAGANPRPGASPAPTGP